MRPSRDAVSLSSRLNRSHRWVSSYLKFKKKNVFLFNVRVRLFRSLLHYTFQFNTQQSIYIFISLLILKTYMAKARRNRFFFKRKLYVSENFILAGIVKRIKKSNIFRNNSFVYSYSFIYIYYALAIFDETWFSGTIFGTDWRPVTGWGQVNFDGDKFLAIFDRMLHFNNARGDN